MKDKVIIVTGATSGLGAAAAKAFAAKGAKVIFCGRRAEQGIQVENDIRNKGGEATFIQADVTVEAQVSHMVKETLRLYGRLDVAFNNAGGNLGISAIENTSAEQFLNTIRLNLTGTFYALKHEIQAMKGSGGSIINTASTAGLKGVGQHLAAYVAAKHGVIGLTKAAALENARNQVRVNAIAPGVIQTEKWLEEVQKTPGQLEKIAAMMPNGKLANESDIIPFVLFLASDDAKFITGTTLAIDGGLLAG
ncbi:NAD(P)-dependent dehydrogenase, short-chain alcohol dehydrogenase family [Pedobacter sp. ok626]|uniref:SDR family NAD(P)-dependent oxidoreductase n=1 Tax=Pedobacter sp. ok626 TaxID=1761882 RepID=UPI0008825668|nr:SDR family oxidoreductase [Pedobacter sp. ok626]SDL35015.1 NAD(P)-dependent dehydrogenase, short-chain alcohol dehydrogenase family [Pedobacter sp. ok626]